MNLNKLERDFSHIFIVIVVEQASTWPWILRAEDFKIIKTTINFIDKMISMVKK